jgi:hypothetical protein
MEVSAVASSKAALPIDVTLAGIVMEVSAVVPVNTYHPMDVRALVPPNVTLESEVAS